MTKVGKLKFDGNTRNLLAHEEAIIPIAENYEIPLEGTQIVGMIYPIGTIEILAENNLEVQIQQAIDDYTLKLIEGGII